MPYTFDELLERGRAAVASGADPEAVIQRTAEYGGMTVEEARGFYEDALPQEKTFGQKFSETFSNAIKDTKANLLSAGATVSPGLRDNAAEAIVAARTRYERPESAERVTEALGKQGEEMGVAWESKDYMGAASEMLDIIGAAAWQTITNPEGMLLTLTEQAGNFFSTYAPAFAGRMVGAAVGAAGGPIGATGGFFTGQGLGQVSVEMGASVRDQIEEKLGPDSTPEEIMAFLNDPQLLAEARERGLKKGGSVAAGDIMANAFALKVLKPLLKDAAKAKKLVDNVHAEKQMRLAEKAARVAAAQTGQVIGTAAGEGVGQYWSKGEIDWADFALEVGLEVPGGVADSVVTMYGARPKTAKEESTDFLDELDASKGRIEDLTEQTNIAKTLRRIVEGDQGPLDVEGNPVGDYIDSTRQDPRELGPTQTAEQRQALIDQIPSDAERQGYQPTRPAVKTRDKILAEGNQKEIDRIFAGGEPVVDIPATQEQERGDAAPVDIPAPAAQQDTTALSPLPTARDRQRAIDEVPSDLEAATGSYAPRTENQRVGDERQREINRLMPGETVAREGRDLPPVTESLSPESLAQATAQPEAATEATAPVSQDIVKANGQPYPTERSAKAGLRGRKLEGYAPVETENGWVLRPEEPVAPTAVEPVEGEQDLQFKRGEAKPSISDPRIKRDFFRTHLKNMAGELTKGGDISLTGGLFSPLNDNVARDKETPVQRTPSINPDWFKGLNEDAETRMSVGDVQKAVDKALAGERLGVRQQRIVERMMDVISEQRTEPSNMQAAQNERQQAREARTGKPLNEVRLEDVVVDEDGNEYVVMERADVLLQDADDRITALNELRDCLG